MHPCMVSSGAWDKTNIISFLPCGSCRDAPVCALASVNIKPDAPCGAEHLDQHASFGCKAPLPVICAVTLSFNSPFPGSAARTRVSIRYCRGHRAPIRKKSYNPPHANAHPDPAKESIEARAPSFGNRNLNPPIRPAQESNWPPESSHDSKRKAIASKRCWCLKLDTRKTQRDACRRIVDAEVAEYCKK